MALCRGFAKTRVARTMIKQVEVIDRGEPSLSKETSSLFDRQREVPQGTGHRIRLYGVKRRHPHAEKL